MAELNNIPDKTATVVPSELKRLADIVDMQNRRDNVGEVYPILDK